MQMISIYNKSKNPNLRFGFLFKFYGIDWILYRSAAGKHIVTCDPMRELVMLDKGATVADLRRELIKIVDNLYQRRKNKPVTIYRDNGIEVVKSKDSYYLNYSGESMTVEQRR